jgi:hypothetical protein
MKPGKVEPMADGSIEISIGIHKKAIRAMDGKFRTLVSYDGGEHWVLDGQREQTRIGRADTLHPGYTAKAEAASASAREVSTLPADPPDPVMVRIQKPSEPRGGRGKAKTPRRLKTIHLKEKPATAHHLHRCHGKQFVCTCTTPYFKRKCGGTICLIEHAERSSL